jgi:polysaccharide pyruvyl transferase WcaK-like protein
MKIVIVNAFERGNRGDAALLSVAIAQVREAFPGVRVAIAGFERPEDRPEFDGTPNLGSVRRYVGDESAGRIARISRKAAALGLAAVAALPGAARPVRLLARLLPGEMRAEITALADADLVLSLGGGYLNARDDFASDLNIAFLLLPLWLAQRFKVPVVLGPQSFGPFPRRRQQAMIRRVVGAARRTVVREAISVDRLAEAGMPLDRVERGVDSAFAFRGTSRRPWRAELGVPAAAELVLVTARRYLAEPEQTRYEAAMAVTVRHLLDRPDCHVVLVPQVTCAFQGDDDRTVNARIAAAIRHPRLHVLDDAALDHHDVFALYALADAIVGTRFHSVIFGLTAGVPCLAVEYDHKTRGIMRELGLEQWVIRMSEARPESLAALADALMADRDAYRAHLAATLPDYRARAAEFTGLLRRSAAPAGDPPGGHRPAQEAARS